VLLDVHPVLAQVDRQAEQVRCPGEPLSRARRVLVVREDRLGDVVLTLPAIRALRRTYPDAWFGLLVRPSLAGFAELCDDVDEVVVDPGTRASAERAMAEFRPDATVFVSREPRLALAARRARLPHRVGTGRRLYSWSFHRRVDERRRGGGRHEVEYGLSFAHRLGASPAPAEFPVTVPDAVHEATAHWLALHGVPDRFVVLHPGSGGSCPAWPVAHHVQLAAMLSGQGVGVVFSIGPADVDVHATLDAEPRTIRRIPRLSGSVATLAALAQRAAAVVASSTGPIHLATALGTPALAFHAPWDSCGIERWGPYGERGWALVADAREARRWPRSRRREHGPSLMAALSPSIALRCVEALLDDRTPSIASAEA